MSVNPSDSNSERPSDDSEIVVIGRIGGPYGVQGWVRVNTFTDPPRNLIDYSPWCLCPAAGVVDSLPLDDPGWREVPVLDVRAHQQAYVARLEGDCGSDGR